MHPAYCLSTTMTRMQSTRGESEAYCLCAYLLPAAPVLSPDDAVGRACPCVGLVCSEVIWRSGHEKVTSEQKI
ncbi:Os03g0771900 [Oryza sativa Japonica Group]|uniref:Os03g0771900 protein n=1 Tax=Oryza sativa subsp. japonica TaxID=39947 RepID=A0A0P0W458_ORYSJ|nr:Os03g0771900 [Oryza sativa Japonica Group]